VSAVSKAKKPGSRRTGRAVLVQSCAKKKGLQSNLWPFCLSVFVGGRSLSFLPVQLFLHGRYEQQSLFWFDSLLVLHLRDWHVLFRHDVGSVVGFLQRGKS